MNVFSIPVDFKEILIEKNPPLSQEELELEMKKDGSMQNRKFEYCYEEPEVLVGKKSNRIGTKVAILD
jgi:hypothetical protein